MNRVAVYGTLRMGMGNHYLLKDSKYLCSTSVRGKMYSLGGFPCVVLSKNLETDYDSYVYCEVYLVDDETLGQLDQLEGYPGWYDRDKVVTPFGGAYIYHFKEPPITSDYVPGGDWVEYVDNRGDNVYEM